MRYLKEEIELLKNLSSMDELNAKGKAKLREFEGLLIVAQNQDQSSPIDDVVEQSEQVLCGDLIKHNFSMCKIDRCVPCERQRENVK